MGYGILFIASILLMNFTYYVYTDLICALLMTLAFMRLAPLQREYRLAGIFSLVLAALGAAELVYAVCGLFMPTQATVISCFAVARALLLGTVTVLMLLGIRATAKEVGLGRLAVRCESTLVMPIILYGASLVLELLELFSGEGIEGLGIAAAIMILLTFVMHVVNAVTVYKAYARICMPEDVEMAVRPSRFAFINRMRAEGERREAERRAEAQALYEKRMQSKKNKKKKKKSKKK